MNDSKILVAYFSAMGTTKQLAETNAEVIGGSGIGTSGDNIEACAGSGTWPEEQECSEVLPSLRFSNGPVVLESHTENKDA